MIKVSDQILHGCRCNMVKNHKQIWIYQLSQVNRSAAIWSILSSFLAQDLSAVATTTMPGLALCLRVGLDYSKQLVHRTGLPFIPVHHMEAHALTIRMIHTWVWKDIQGVKKNSAHEEIKSLKLFPTNSLGLVIIQLINERTWVEIALRTFRMPERCC